MLFPERTLCSCQREQSAVSKENSVFFPKKRMCSFQKEQCVRPKENSVFFPPKKIDVAETGTPKPVRRNRHAETVTPKRPRRKFAAKAPKPPRRNRNDEEFFRKNKFRWPYDVDLLIRIALVNLSPLPRGSLTQVTRLTFKPNHAKACHATNQ